MARLARHSAERRIVLLFDSECATCSRLAAEVRAASPALSVDSLQNPDIRGLLDRERPGWKLEPMLLVYEAERPRIATGWRMRRLLMRVVGVRAAMRIAGAAGCSSAGAQGPDGIDRRGLLGRAAAGVGALLLGSRVLGGGGQAAASTTSVVALSPEDAVVGRLKRMRAAKAAARHYGRPDWSGVQRLRQRAHHDAKGRAATAPADDVYVVPIPATKANAEPAVLVLALPARDDSFEGLLRRARAITGDNSLFDDNVVLQVAQAGTRVPQAAATVSSSWARPQTVSRRSPRDPPRGAGARRSHPRPGARSAPRTTPR